MRKSDSIKSNKFVDKFSSDLHDEILIKLYKRFSDVEFAKKFGPLKFKSHSAFMEKPLINMRSRKILGFVDLAVNYADDDGYSWYAAFFEVKTKINVGEVVRQLRYYLVHSEYNETKLWVCAPLCEHIDILEDHGIGFLDSNTL